VTGETLRLRHLVKELRTGPFGSALSADEYVDEGVPLINPSDLRAGRIWPDRAVKVPEAVANRMSAYRVENGDIVLARRGELGRYGLVGKDEAGFLCGTGSLLVRPGSNLVAKFLGYYLETADARNWLSLQSVGSTMENLSEAILARLPVPKISKEKQVAIADFLDEQTARIDALIAEKERLIASLVKSTTELLHAAVTKGLGSAPMKSSAREWIGEIPSHWSAPFIRFVARIESGHTPSRQHPEYWVGCSIPWFSLADVWQIRDGKREIVTETSEMVSELGVANSSARVLPANTVILSRTASVGFSAIMGVPMATTQDFVNWVCGEKVMPEYLLYVFRAMGSEFQRLKYGSTHSTIYMPDVAKLSMPLPPLDEQRAIVALARDRKARMEDLSDSAKKAVERLREYRSSLISATVTDQLDINSYKEAA